MLSKFLRGPAPGPYSLPRGRPFQPVPCVSGLFVALVELDVASTRMRAAQIATGEVAVGQLDLEYVVATRLALVAHAHARGARLTVNRDVVVNDAAIRVVRVERVARHGGGLHVHAVAMINVVEMAPERAVLDAALHPEVRLVSRRRARDPSATRHKVARWCAAWRWRVRDGGTSDSGGGRAEDHVHACE